MENLGYYSQPSIYQSTVVFVSDDDLWITSIDGGIAIRLTSKEGLVMSPRISPDGKWVAYIGNESGDADVFLVPINGGKSKRLTYFGVNSGLTWKDNKTLVFHSSSNQFHRAVVITYELDIHTLEYKEMNVGPCSAISFQKQSNRKVIGRNSLDSARWKRYQGGTAGKLWVEQENKGSFKQILKDINYNLASPLWIDDKIYFVSDFDGNGNIYSVNPNGRGLKRHTHLENFYVRNIQSDGENIVFHAGGDLFYMDIKTDALNKIEVDVPTSGIQARERFESAAQYLDVCAVSNAKEKLAIIARGKIFQMNAWLGGPLFMGANNESRYNHVRWLNNDKLLVATKADKEGEEHLVLFDSEKLSSKNIVENIHWGKVWSIVPSPKNTDFCVTNNKNELWLIHPEKNKAELLVREKLSRIEGVNWSPDGRYIAFSATVTNGKPRSGIKIYDLKMKKVHLLLNPISSDWSPSFDPSGKYLFFIGCRDLKAMYAETHFDLSFPMASRPYVVALNSNVNSPFETHLFKAETKKETPESKKKTEEKPKDVVVNIDFENIEHRVLAFDLPLGGYKYISCYKDKVCYLRTPTKPEILPWNVPDEDMTLYQFSFEANKEEVFHRGVKDLAFSLDKNQILLQLAQRKLKLVSTESIPKGEADAPSTDFSKNSGWINLNRINLKIDPRSEWAQMYREAWVLQREHFWTEDMSKIEWQKVYTQYASLLPRIKTRSEFSDLMWEMQGELGTSHCYEFMGDYYIKKPYNPLGKLGAEFKFNPKMRAFEIVEIYQGDSWKKNSDSSLSKAGVALKKGDLIFSVDGIPFENHADLDKTLLNRANAEVNLYVQRAGKKEKEYVTVSCLPSHQPVLYRQWVEKNKEYVHKKSNGKLGYVHIPDMMSNGYSEFYRHFIAECGYEGLVVDVRFNGGGHVSQHILKALAQKVIGVDVTRWSGVETYPTYGMLGPVVAVTNEYAGSDGDIFSHSFKLMKIGKLIGKRTWGGVIGINGQYQLTDRTMTTQPEYSFWFEDVGYAVENYGTDPDIEIEMTPEDWAKKTDPQLDESIKVALGEMKKNPPKNYKLQVKPNLKKPRLPK